MLLNRHAFIFKSKPKAWLAGITEALKQVISDTLRPLSLTAITNPAKRIAKEGLKNIVPRTSEEFEEYWHGSPEYASILEKIKQYQKDFYFK
jgi:hypothetical protein